MDKIEIHTKEYGITKSKDPLKDGVPIGLQTRLLITPPKGAKNLLEFEMQHEAITYIREHYGDVTNMGKTYKIMSNFSIYGNRGYRWK